MSIRTEPTALYVGYVRAEASGSLGLDSGWIVLR